MTTTDERTPLDPTISEIHRLIDSIGVRLDTIAAALDSIGRPPVDMLAVDLGTPTGHHPAVATMPVADVPVDGSVEVRPVCGQGRFGPWVHVIGEQQRAVGGEGNRSLLVDGITEPFTWHRDQCVQVRPFRPADEDLVDARHRAQTGGL